MSGNYYVLGTHTNEGLFFITEVTENKVELEIKASNDFRRARVVEDLESCKEMVKAFEHEAILNIYKINLEEVAE